MYIYVKRTTEHINKGGIIMRKEMASGYQDASNVMSSRASHRACGQILCPRQLYNNIVHVKVGRALVVTPILGATLNSQGFRNAEHFKYRHVWHHLLHFTHPQKIIMKIDNNKDMLVEK